MGIFENGNFAKVMFLLISIFLATVVLIQMRKGSDDMVTEIMTTFLVFFAFAGRSIVETYKGRSSKP